MMDDQTERTTQTEEEAPEKPKKDMTTFYWIRTFLGGYLIYLAWQLLQSVLQGTAQGTIRIVSIIAAVVFVLAGGFLVAWSLKLLFGRK